MAIPIKKANTESPKIAGINGLRVLMSWFVVMWHVLLFNLQSGSPVSSDIFSKTRCSAPEYTLLDFISFQILLMAVPMFILISNYLFARNHILFPVCCDSESTAKPSDSINNNAENRDNINMEYSFFLHEDIFCYLKKRIKRHILLFSFWFSVFIVYIAHFKSFSAIYTVPDTVSGILVFFLSGGSSPYYFFLCLTVSLIITYSARKLSIVELSMFFAGATLLIMILPYISRLFQYPSLVAYWNPLNFIPYPLLALLMARSRCGQKTIKNRTVLITVMVLVVLSILLSVMEWKFYTSDVFFEYQGYGIPAYTRTSLICSCTATMLIFLYFSPVVPSSGIFLGRLWCGMISFMAKHALALYCLHFYLIIPVNKMIRMYVDLPVLVVCITTVITAVICYVLSIILGFYLKDELIR